MTDGSFARDGFVGPVPLLTKAQCSALLAHLASDQCPPPAEWDKGRAVTDWRVSRLAAHPQLLRLLTPLLGEDIILWGASLVHRKPDQVHRWHVDIESSSPEGRFVTAWIGLANTSRDSGLRLIAGSQSVGKTVQQFQTETGRTLLDASTETVLEWAQGANADAQLVEPEMKDGDVILFDGRIWHGSHNRSDLDTRSAILLQYAAADSPARMPDRRVATWPFKLLDTPPPAILMHGSAASRINRIVPAPQPPAETNLPALRSSIRRLDTPLAEPPGGGWKPYPLFRGPTPALDFMSCHAAVLSAGHSPHQPHSHPDEELLIMLDGEAELLIADRPDSSEAQVVAVKAGDFAYYPPRQHHTIRNSSSLPVTYMMFRWRRAGGAAADKRLKTTVFRSPPPVEAVPGRGFATRSVLDAPTRWLRKLHCHASRLEVGAGYAPHADPYDLAILVKSGRIRTLRQEVGPGGLVYCPAGEMHGMRNVGDEPAQYLVFEFHGAPQPAAAGEIGAGTSARPAPALQAV